MIKPSPIGMNPLPRQIFWIPFRTFSDEAYINSRQTLKIGSHRLACLYPHIQCPPSPQHTVGRNWQICFRATLTCIMWLPLAGVLADCQSVILLHCFWTEWFLTNNTVSYTQPTLIPRYSKFFVYFVILFKTSMPSASICMYVSAREKSLFSSEKHRCWSYGSVAQSDLYILRFLHARNRSLVRFTKWPLHFDATTWKYLMKFLTFWTIIRS